MPGSNGESEISWQCSTCGFIHSGISVDIRGTVEAITTSRYLERISSQERRSIDSGWKTKEEVKKWSRVRDKVLACSSCLNVVMVGALYSEIGVFIARHPAPPDFHPQMKTDNQPEEVAVGALEI